MQLEDNMLSEVSQDQKHKRLSYMEDRSKDKHTQKETWSYTNSVVEHVCNSGTALWDSGKEKKEKRKIEQQ
jgi:hypothetical protein